MFINTRKKKYFLNIIQRDNIKRTRMSKIAIKLITLMRKEIYLTINTFDWFDLAMINFSKENFTAQGF